MPGEELLHSVNERETWGRVRGCSPAPGGQACGGGFKVSTSGIDLPRKCHAGEIQR